MRRRRRRENITNCGGGNNNIEEGKYKSKNNGENLLPRSLVMKLFEATSWFC